MTKRAALIGLSVALLAAGAALAWLLTSEAGLRFTWARAAAWAPGELRAERLEGRLLGPVSIMGLEYRAEQTRVRIGRLAFDWLPSALLRGTLDIERVEIADVEVRHTPAPRTARPPPAGLDLPLAIEIGDAHIDKLSVQIGADAAIPIARMRLRAAARGRQLQIAQFELVSPVVSATASGRAALAPPYALDLALAITVAPPELAPLNARGTLRGDARRAALEAELASPWSARLSATVSEILTDLRWDAALAIMALDLHAISERWPALTVAGRIAASGDREQLAVRELALVERGADRALDASGTWRFGHGAPLAVNLAWRNLRWPLTGPAAWRSPAGTAQARGSFDDYALAVQATVTSAMTGDIPLRAQGRGTRQGLAALELSARWLGGELTGRGELRWHPHLAWSTQLSGRDLDPGTRYAEWPGRLQLQARTEGDLRAGLRAGAVIEELSGALRGRTLQARGAFRLDGDRYGFEHIEVQVGDARLSANGRVDTQWNLDWRFDAADLADLWPGARGAVNASGALRGARATPRLLAHAGARAVTIGPDRVAELRAQLDVDFSDENPSAFDVSARDLRWRALTLDALALSGAGSLRAHELRASATRQTDRATVAVRGGASATGWTGSVTQAGWTSAAQTWQLAEPAGLTLGRRERRLERLCLAHAAGGRLCLAGEWPQTGGAQASAEATAVPLALATRWFLPDTELHGTFGGEAVLRVAADGSASGALDVEVGAGELRRALDHDETVTLGFEGGRLAARAQADRLAARAELRLGPQADARAEVSVPFTPFKAPGADRSVTGTVEARLADLSRIAAWLAPLEEPRGRLQLTATLGGTAEDLAVEGEASLEQARVGLSALGITLEDVELRARTRADGRIGVTGRARSGGAIAIDGTAALRAPDDWMVELALRGQDFEAMRTPELALTASPDVTLRISPRRVDVSGEVRVNRALIAPRALRVATQVSPDVVIVSEDGAPARLRPWAVSSRLRAVLGRQVRVSALNFDGYVEGDVTVTSAPDTPTVGHGELRVARGKYRIYGSDLDIERGTLTFTGGAVDNPQLDLRATRRVRTVLAGIDARGPLKTPEITLFSEPPLNQSDIFSYIVFGHPVSETGGDQHARLAQALTSLSLAGGELLARDLGAALGIEEVRISTGDQGGASLLLGTYLSPRLYVALGVGLFQTGNTLRISYDISDRWQIVTDTGVYTGADLLYRIER